MSLETDQWTALSAAQAAFFKPQLEAARQIAFSATAHEAGIVALNAARYTAAGDSPEDQYSAIMWPDASDRNSLCVVTVSNHSSHHLNFARITENSESFTTEGLTLGLNFSAAGNLYGRQLALKHGPLYGLHSQIAADFFRSGIKKARELNDKNYPQLAERSLRLGIVGIDGTTSARLFSALSSLNSNLLVVGAMEEKNFFNNATYDLANALLKMVMTGIMTNTTSDNGLIIPGPNGKPAGAIFESQHDGITVVRRTNDYPDTIELVTANRPSVDDTHVFAERYAIKAHSAGLDVMTLPAESYHPQSVANMLLQADNGPRDKQNRPPDLLDQTGNRALQQKIMRILSERTNQTT